MTRVYDNGDKVLGSVYDVKDYICRNCEDYEDVKDIMEELENYDEDTIVVLNYSFGMGCIIESFWRDKDKVIREMK